MSPARAALVLVIVAATAAPASELTVSAGRLRADVTLDPWRVAFSDEDRGVVLTEGDAEAPGSGGSVGFRTADGWAHAVRALSYQRRGTAIVAVLETTDPAGRRMLVRVAPDGSGIVAVE